MFGFALAIVLALMKLSPVAPYRWLATGYIEFFRGLPALIVILVMAFGVPIAFGWSPPGGLIGAGLLALILVAGAYMAETLRAGIQAVPKGQTEAARSLGMSAGRTTVSVVLPQAFRIVIPPLTNEFVLLIKDTALLFVIGVEVGQRELTTRGPRPDHVRSDRRHVHQPDPGRAALPDHHASAHAPGGLAREAPTEGPVTT